MSLLAVIPARLDASRLPRKPLRDVGGAPLVLRVWERVRGFGMGDHVVVATDSVEIADVVTSAGGDAVLTRADHVSGTDRVAEVARRPEFAGFDAIVNVQGDEPFVSADAIRGAIAVVVSGAAPIGTVAVADDPIVLAASSVVKVVVADDGRALYFSRAAIPHLRDPGDAADLVVRDGLVRRHVGVYAYTRDALLAWVALPVHALERVERLEQLRPLAHGLAIGVATVADAGAPGVDTEEDLARADAYWRRHVAASGDPGPHSAANDASSDVSRVRLESVR